MTIPAKILILIIDLKRNVQSFLKSHIMEGIHTPGSYILP